MGAVVVASDLGSSGCKTMVVDAGGRVLAAASQEYRNAYPRPGWVEQDPDDWLRAACVTTRKAMARADVPPSSVAAYGVVGVTHNAVLLGGDGAPLRPSILLFDTRSEAECAAIDARFGDTVVRRARNAVSPAWTWPQLAWVRDHEPECWAKTRRVLFQKDYVRDRIAPSFVTDTIDAAGSLLFDPVEEDWIGEFVHDLGLDDAALPEAVPPTRVVGAITGVVAQDMGLLAGTPVIAGTTDTAAEVLGAGALTPGQATVKLASVGRITAVARAPAAHPMMLNYRHVLDGLWYPGTATKYAATAYRWLREAAAPDLSFAALTEAAEASPPGAHGLLFQPHLNGEWAPYWDAARRGAFIGLTAAHSRGDMARAVMEGVGFAMVEALAFAEGAGLACTELRLLGGGSGARLWSQILADILGRDLLVPAERDAAYGAALIVGMGAGLFPKDAAALAKLIRVEDTIRADAGRAAVYRDLAAIYREAETALAPIHHRLTAFAHHGGRV